MSPSKLLQMKGQRCRWDIKRFANAASRHAFRPSLDQYAEDREPGFLGECRKRPYTGSYFYISSIIEITSPSMRSCVDFGGSEGGIYYAARLVLGEWLLCLVRVMPWLLIQDVVLSPAAPLETHRGQ